MDLPLGKMVFTRDLKASSKERITENVDLASFVGYIRAFIKEKSGKKKDLYLVLDEGEIVAADTTYLEDNTTKFGKNSLEDWQIEKDAEISVSIHSLTKDQLKILIEFNEECCMEPVRFEDWRKSLQVKSLYKKKEILEVAKEELGNLGEKILEKKIDKEYLTEEEISHVFSDLEKSSSLIVGSIKAKKAREKIKDKLRRDKSGFWL